MLILKITDKNRRTRNGFQWPERGLVSCPDWDSSPRCGGGLHGWANGEGSYRHTVDDGFFLIVDVLDSDMVSLDGGEKCKFQKGNVVYCGTRVGAVAFLIERGAMTDKSNPAWVCLTLSQRAEVAMRCADRAVRVYAPQHLRAQGLVEDALRLEQLPTIKDQATARNAADAAYAADYHAAYAADAAADAAYAADYHAAIAADAAADAADAAANAAAIAADAAADAAHAAEREREAVRLDKCRLLGLIPPVITTTTEEVSQ